MSVTPPPPPPPPPPSPPPPGGPSPGWVPGGPPTSRGFLSRLFDTSFTEFITPGVVRVLYVLAMVLAGLYAVFFLVAGLAALADGNGGGLVLIVVSPVAFLLMVIYARVALEVVLALFRIAENTEHLRGRP